MTFLRFLYINSYAFSLFILGVLLFILPMDIFLLIVKILVSIWSIAGGIIILSQWKMKLRKIPLLVARNKKNIRPDIFKKLNETLCGRLMVNAALSDLRKSENYRNLSNDEWMHCKAIVFEKAKQKKRKNHR
jgi:hypothetical protein